MSAFRYYTETRFGNPPTRHKVVRWRGFEGYWTHWTDACHGCTDDGDYIVSSSGSGCDECGYTGKRRRSWFMPLDLKAWDRRQKRVYERYERLSAYWNARTKVDRAS